MKAALPPNKDHASGMISSRRGTGAVASSNTPKVKSVTGHGAMPNMGCAG